MVMVYVVDGQDGRLNCVSADRRMERFTRKAATY